ncbi:MAG: hypothetical protein IPG00_04245 [Saprospiraceae bacterium]|nr:hypothetical protein [Saprospiraceae bacterium]
MDRQVGMDNLHQIQINFDQSQVLLLNICLGILMFGVALDLKVDDFKYVVKSPKSIIVGLISRLVLLPLMTLRLIYILHPAYSLMMGMALIAACPGGNVSNYATHLSKGKCCLISYSYDHIYTLLCLYDSIYFFYITAFYTSRKNRRFRF